MADQGVESVLTKADSVAIEKLIIAETIQGLFYGLECVVFFAATYKLFRRGLSRTRRVLLVILILIFLCSAATAVSNLVQDLVQIRQLGEPDYSPMLAKQKASIVATFSTRISYFLGDAIVVWRAWIIVGDVPRARFALGTCLLASFVALIVNIIYTMKQLLIFGFRPQPGPRLMLPTTLLITNIVATSLIAWRIWRYRVEVTKYLKYGKDGKRGQVERVLTLLLESGILYSFLWVMSLIATSNPQPQFYDFTVFLGTILPHASGIYPSMIILFAPTDGEDSTYGSTTVILQGSVPDFLPTSINTSHQQGQIQRQEPIHFATTRGGHNISVNDREGRVKGHHPSSTDFDPETTHGYDEYDVTNRYYFGMNSMSRVHSTTDQATDDQSPVTPVKDAKDICEKDGRDEEVNLQTLGPILDFNRYGVEEDRNDNQGSGKMEAEHEVRG
ncbi:hypothetical protein K435DRAFT_960154 [Dendrothele bispora CBS 962.96]|uniref:Uncharacterized protein n=1 Tax=Dendrothele bispora (strain CBS 962.96) TaxID=1314807 RepID=A0A4S8MUW9_DENBC|nr:hypothetical protein K435DRAFT_960154 [Dendrothele bispora CBS 962.96]